ncbi:MAG TPA: Gfo/Idh/MocA family oxidoreductase [Candidatus Hydrogenedentes bacterium]|nr:Gfo/Idh/MocA family oxidoreductase [Candidatus Hydrogenedentota bacterium]HPG67150.1 Gfo/Idh/MocA family oxidoreductase [Candidatus Hydrogenedentota bacterium]
MKRIARRSFLQTVAGVSAVAWSAPSLAAAGANERVTVGVLGCSRGLYVAREMGEKDIRIAYVCDPDETRRAKAREETNADQAVADMRRVFEDPAVDAVVIATPDHWHVPAALLACEAGKHVYVEKPCSHNIREGRLLIEAARRTGRVVQVGSQSRSTAAIRNGMQLLREGAIGDVLVAKAWNSQRRPDIGHQAPSDPPAGFDYDLWVGPAPMRPFQSNCHHYTWHWWYDFGTGDAGNDGVHELDIARWGLGVDGHPHKVSGHGGKLFFDDDQQFPDTQYVVFEYPGDGAAGRARTLLYEHRIWSPYVQEGFENGNAFFGTDGYMILGKSVGWKLYGPKNEFIREEQGAFSVPDHVADFVDAIRTDRRPNADIEIGHPAAVLAHLGNLLARTGRGTLRFDPAAERILDAPDADALVGRTYREGHWAVPKNV